MKRKKPHPITLSKGQHVTVTGRHGAPKGQVLHTEDPAHLKAISGEPEIERIRGILDRKGIRQLAMIGTLDHSKWFAAVQDAQGNWTDMRNTPIGITIEPGDRPQ